MTRQIIGLWWTSFLALSVMASLLTVVQGATPMEPNSIAPNLFEEELVVKPMPDGKVYAHFQFTTRLPVDVRENVDYLHYNIFPRTIGQLLQKFGVHEMHLTFTQGRWQFNRWGYGITPPSPTGVELWTWMSSKNADVDQNWKSLTNVLAGAFCASLNFMDEATTGSPSMLFRPEGSSAFYGKNSTQPNHELRYAVLPREIVCTENLTPWKKLLPCKSSAGLGKLLNAVRLYDTYYHSMGTHLRPICLDDACTKAEFEMIQTISVVFDPVRKTATRHWSLEGLFGVALEGSCSLASKSKVSVILPSIRDDASSTWSLLSDPDAEVKDENRHVAVYDLKKGPKAIGMNWNEVTFMKVPYGPLTPVRVHRYFTGYGAERGGLVTHIQNHFTDRSVHVQYMEYLPWFMRIYMHTQEIRCEHETTKAAIDTAGIIRDTSYSPAIDRKRPAIMEMSLVLPPGSMTTVSMDYDKAFLKYTEYPPDPNRGFDVSSAIVTAWIPMHPDMIMPQGLDYQHWYNQSKREGWADHTSTMSWPIRITSETLLLTLPTPDFSMPYNVITFTCTVLALFFGSVFNLFMRRFHPITDKDAGPQRGFMKIKAKIMGLVALMRERRAGKGKEKKA